ncbi:hypothetical protein MesoLj113b_28930 [Mesorhizobium sp. 113-3-3]|nr:hypothetical protein MesoLj113b_28930 [Mesorhizobium sp. 113-3-3]
MAPIWIDTMAPISAATGKGAASRLAIGIDVTSVSPFPAMPGIRPTHGMAGSYGLPGQACREAREDSRLGQALERVRKSGTPFRPFTAWLELPA